MMNKLFPIINGVSFISMIIMNYFSNTGVFNGNTMKTVSDVYFNYFTPAGYAFSIWGLIYLNLVGFVFYSGRGLFNANDSDPIISKIGWWFAISCFANSLWVVAWLYELAFISVLLMLLILFSLIRIITIIRMNLNNKSFKNRLFILFPFTLYVGWISVASIANIAAALTKIEWNGWGISEIYWTITMLVVAGIVNVFVLWKWNLPAFAAVGVWALIAISASNNTHDGPKSIIYTCYAVASILLILILKNLIKKTNRPLLDK